MDQQSIEKSPGTGTRLLSSSAERSWTMPQTPEKTGHDTILLVDTRLAALRRTGELLRRVGHHVIETGSFQDAKCALAVESPQLVISSLRLGPFNGLHLVHLGRLADPGLAAIIISPTGDTVLQTEADRIGATLLVEPVPTASLLALIAKLMPSGSQTERRAGDRRSVCNSGFAPERRVDDRRASE